MKKKIVIIVSIVAVFSISVCATLAFLTDEEKSLNTFTVGKVNIVLKETDVDELGVPIEGAEPVTENEYHLLPGKTYVKDPTITIEKGSEESYIRMLVTLNLYKEIKEVLGEGFTPGNYIEGYDMEKWIYEGSEENLQKNTITYEFRYYKTIDGFNGAKEESKVLEPLFATLKIPENLEANDLAKLSSLEIKVVAHAIQAEGFENDDAAWDAFTKQHDA